MPGPRLPMRKIRDVLRLSADADEIGHHTAALVEEIILQERTHPAQGFRACVGILRLAKTYGRGRLEAACSRALDICAALHFARGEPKAFSGIRGDRVAIFPRLLKQSHPNS